MAFHVKNLKANDICKTKKNPFRKHMYFSLVYTFPSFF